MDNLSTCNRCGGDACYTQQVTPQLKTYWCYGCGFISNDLMKEGEEYFAQQINGLPDLYLDLLYKDSEGRYWMPSTVTIEDKGMVFAQGTNPREWRWTAVKAVKRTKEDLKKNPKNKAEYKMDMVNQKHFEEKNYMDALEHIGVFQK